MRQFTDADLRNTDTQFPRIYADRSELIVAQPDWMKRGRQQTAS